MTEQEKLKNLQNNPHNKEFWKSRGLADRPKDYLTIPKNNPKLSKEENIKIFIKDKLKTQRKNNQTENKKPNNAKQLINNKINQIENILKSLKQDLKTI